MNPSPFTDWLPGTEDIKRFERDGFLIAPSVVDPGRARALSAGYWAFFNGQFPTGSSPEKWTRINPKDVPPQTRWGEKAWRSDPRFSVFSLQSQPAKMIAMLSGWSGARLFIDAAQWKPPGAGRVPFHYDNSYMQWAVPPTMNALWIALEDVTLCRGPMMYARGSHRWPRFETSYYAKRTQSGVGAFLDENDFSGAVEAAAREAEETVDYQIIQLPAGGGVFHDGWTWHGSEANTDARDRVSLSIHCMPHEATYSPDFKDPIESRYQRFDSLEIDDAYFPVLWTDKGHRSPWVDEYIARGLQMSV